MLAQPSRPPSTRYDLLIRGGRVVDPSQRIDRVLDVAIAGGRIAAVGANLPAANAADVIDARGHVVTPGLVDIHAHIYDGLSPADLLRDGTTAFIDAGSRGADNVDDVAALARSAPVCMRVFLNLSRRGLIDQPELLDFDKADAVAARRAIEANRDVVIGVKARLSKNVCGERDQEVIRRAHEITVPLGLPLMVHIGQTASPLPALLALLRPGDIVTHIYAPPPNGIFDEHDRLFPQVLETRRRGIRYDVGNGRNGHITWAMAEKAIAQGLLPDTISSDLTAGGRTDRVFDFPTVLSKFLLLGLTLSDVIARATVNAATVVPAFTGRGTLADGAIADVAMFELQQGNFEFVDNERTPRTGRQKLVTRAVIVNGQRVA